MKKFLSALFTIALTFSTVTTVPASFSKSNATFYLNISKYMIGSTQYEMDAAPFIEDGRIFVPIRFLAYACGVSDQGVQWNDVFQTVTLKKGNTTLQLQLGIDQAIKNDYVEELDVGPIMKNGRTFLPARWIAEALAYKVQWNEASKTVLISQT
ncbi:hypothetical protein JCM14036_31640 [Desulfotomaculum defluvii]